MPRGHGRAPARIGTGVASARRRSGAVIAGGRAAADPLRPGAPLLDTEDAVLHLAPDGTIRACSPACAALLGRAPEALVGLRAEHVLGPLPAFDRPFPVRHPAAHGRGFPGPDGTCWIALEGPGRDVLEGRLRDADSRFRAIFETVSCGISVLDAELRVVEANREWGRIQGMDPAELVGRKLADFVAEDEREAHNERGARLRTGRSDGVQHRRVRHRSGAVVHVEGTATPFLLDGETRLLAFIFDVTALHEAEEARRASDERFRLAFENAPIGIGLFEPDGRARTLNDSFAKMLGATPGALVGRPLDALVVAEDLPIVAACLSPGGTCIDSTSNLRFRLRAADGHHLLVNGGFAPLHDSAGRVTGYVAHAVDLTEQLRLEEQVRRAQRSETIGRIAGGVAHDFNNALGVIRGAVELLQIKARDPARTTELLDRIDAAARRAADLTRQLTILGRRDFTTSGTSNPYAVLQDIRPVIAGALGEGITLEIAVDVDVPEIGIARPHLEQLLLNLTMNAREAMADGGTFRIAARAVTLHGDEPRAGELHGTFVEWQVTDDGAGMPPEVAAVAFEPFFTTKAREKGSGLGLAIVQSVVSQAGGHVDLATRPGAGTTFRLYLPVESGQEVAPPPERAAGRAGRGQTLLLCEDEPDLLEIFTCVLQDAGYRVHATSDPHEAIRLGAQHDRIDALITDVVMPGMRGTVLAAEIRRRHPNAPVLFVSGYSEERIGSAADPSSGAFLPKPFLPSDLVQAIHVLLS